MTIRSKNSMMAITIALIILSATPDAFAGPVASSTRREAKRLLSANVKKSEALFLDSCNAGAGISCRDYAKLVEERGLITRAARYYGWACTSGMADSCLLSGRAWTTKGELKKAIRMFVKGCKLHSDESCQLAKNPAVEAPQNDSTLTKDPAIEPVIESAAEILPVTERPPEVEPEKSREEINKPVEIEAPAVEAPVEGGFDYWKSKAQ